MVDGNGQRDGVGAQNRADLVDDAEEIRADTVHLVDERDARDMVFLRLPPDGFRLRFDAADGAEEADGAVQNTQGAFDFDGEIDVSGSVDDIDLMVAPDAGGGGAGDRDAALLFLHHEVHGRLAVMGFAHLVVAACIEKDAFRAGGLACVDMRHDTDVADFFEWILT